MSIQILPARLANQIAAGEVVERPASVVKELIENSLDAGATQIDVEIEKGGHKRICIRDNGVGIEQDELGLALSRHATSKITCLDDLEQILSLGFRGEALASVSSVARLSITSKTQEQTEAWQAHAQGREMEVQLNPAAHPKGTSVEVLDLFFNTPARRKFLRTEKTEFAHIDELIKRISLSRFDVGFSVKHNAKLVHKYTVADNQKSREKRMAAICGKDFAVHALQISSQYQNLSLSGWLAAPGGERSQNDLQYFYVNGRMMKDKLINHAIRQAFEGLIAPERYPAYVLYLTIEADQVDVNVHPAKHEVRFHQARLVHDFIYRAITDALEQSINQADLEPTDAVRELSNVEPDHSYITPLKPEYFDERNPSAPTGYESSSSYPSPSSGLKQYNRAAGETSAQHYQQLMTVDKPSGSTLNNPWLVIDAYRVLFKQQNEFYLLEVKDLYFEKLLDSFKTLTPVAQPLLMPVSMIADKTLLNQAEQVKSALLEVSVEIDCIAKKIILKKVPAGYRNLPWTQLLPSLITLKDEPAPTFLNSFLRVLADQVGELPEQEIMQLLHWCAHHCDGEAFNNMLKSSRKVGLAQWLASL